MSSYIHKYNRIYAPILIGTTLILGIILLKPLYTEYLNQQVQLTTIEKEKSDKQKMLDELIAMQKTFASSGTTDLTEKVKKLDQKFDVSNIMSVVMLNDYTRPTALAQSRVSISSISVDKGNKLPSGLSLGTVALSLSAVSVDDMVDFITYLTQSSSFVFTINSITLPIDTTTSESIKSSVSLNISLGVYYFE